MERPSDQIVAEIVRRMCAEFTPVAVYQFGSTARGDAGPASDIDILVVVESSTERFFDRAARAQRALRGVPAPVDVQVYTREEFEKRAELPVSFERTVRDSGRVLFAA